MKLINLLFRKLNYHLRSPANYARYLGVSYGDNCLIATKYWSTEPYLIKIGNNVQITSDVRFHTHGGVHVLRKRIATFDTFGKIVINDNCYIGAASHILGGVTIGENSLIAAGSVVTKSIPSNVVVGGNPARIICSCDEFFDKQQMYNVNTKGMSYREKQTILLDAKNEVFFQKELLKPKA